MRVQVPLSPQKGLLDSLIIFILFSRFVNDSNFVIFLIHSILSQTYLDWISFHKSWDRYDTHTNEHLWAKQEIPSPFSNFPMEWLTIQISIRTEIYFNFTKSPFVSVFLRYKIFRDKPLEYFFFFFLIDIDQSRLIKWGRRRVEKGRDSSAGRAEDWKSSCHQFKSGSWHMINLCMSIYSTT